MSFDFLLGLDFPKTSATSDICRLPPGSTRSLKSGYEEVCIPATASQPFDTGEVRSHNNPRYQGGKIPPQPFDTNEVRSHHNQCCSCLFVSGRTVVYSSHYKRPQFPPKIDFGAPNYRLQRLMLRLMLTGPAGLC